MVFSSLLFLFTYLPVVLLIYYLSPLKWRNGVLLIFNLIFYGWGEPTYIILMVFTITADYVAGLLVARFKDRGRDRAARTAVAAALVLNLAILFFFKYWDLIADTLRGFGLDVLPALGLSLPIGISFYTFQTMTYPVDLYRGDAGVQKNLVNFGTFVTLFPQLIAGPILKYKELADQVDRRTYRVEQFAGGVHIFVIGLGKKVLLANNLGQLWDAYKALPTEELTVLGAWLGVAAFSLQLYFDFSGYSDMAIGLGRMLGFEFLKNFDYPYISRSVTEFWRRWHISLGSWFREYVYIPMGGNRVSGGRLCFNLLVVWGLTGLWHGASWTFVLWGAWHGLFATLETATPLRRLQNRKIGRIYALLVVLVGFVLFRAGTLSQAAEMAGNLFAGFALTPASTLALRHLLTRRALASLLVGAVGALGGGAWLWERVKNRRGAEAVSLALTLALLALCVLSLAAGTFQPFIYQQF